ncbi:hypothetical protein [Streptomyces sp. NPDC005078]|uniref:hypothetical protein n=1 Tax=unclassified Streptomyces TaxID=2593676 RepID=UPI0033A1ED00
MELQWLERSGGPAHGLAAQAHSVLAHITQLRRQDDTAEHIVIHLRPVLAYLRHLTSKPAPAVATKVGKEEEGRRGRKRGQVLTQGAQTTAARVVAARGESAETVAGCGRRQGVGTDRIKELRRPGRDADTRPDATEGWIQAAVRSGVLAW